MQYNSYFARALIATSLIKKTIYIYGEYFKIKFS